MDSKQSPRVPSKSLPFTLPTNDNSGESTGGNVIELGGSLNNAEQPQRCDHQQQQQQQHNSINHHDTSAIAGTTHQRRPHVQDGLSGISKKARVERNGENAKTTAIVQHSTFDMKHKSKSVDDQPRNQYVEGNGLELEQNSATSVQHETGAESVVTTGAIAVRGTTMEEKVLAVLAGKYFRSPNEEDHLRDAISAVAEASGDSPSTIKLLTEDWCFPVHPFAFQSSRLTQTVATWILEQASQQSEPRVCYMALVLRFIVGNAPLDAAELLLSKVDLNSLIDRSPPKQPCHFWEICFRRVNIDRVDQSRLQCM